MRTGAAAGHTGFFHQAAIYESDQERHDIIAAHIVEGIDAGEPVIVAAPPQQAWVRAEFGNAANVTLLPPLDASSRPATTIKDLTALLGPLAADGCEQIRVVQAVPHPGVGSPWPGWCRYEAAVNDLLADLPLWGVCLYDRRTTPPDVLVDVESTHPHLLTADGNRRPNGRYVEPVEFLRARNLSPTDPLERAPADVQLIDPSPANTRRAVRDSARRTGLSAEDIDQLVLATSEAVTNALVHGQPPVVMKIWTSLERIVVTISDRGDGPTDPYAGLVPHRPVADGVGGLGLWIIHQLVDASFHRAEHGFTLRLTAMPTPA